MKIDIPKDSYIHRMELLPDALDLDLRKKKKVALVLISLNARYWPYLTQVIKDCRVNFLKNHHVDYFAWTDFSPEEQKTQIQQLDNMVTMWKDATPPEQAKILDSFISIFSNITRLHEQFYPNEVKSGIDFLAQNGIIFKREALKAWIEVAKAPDLQTISCLVDVAKTILRVGFTDMEKTLQGVTITETAPIEWPAPTLMRYHLFLNQEEKLKEYDYIFYLDADMRVVAQIGDEVLGDGLTAAEHPMYSLRKEYIPPYEPNKESTAYINRPGKVVDENGRPRFKPYYYAGGFQGGVAKDFIQAMQTMKKNIDIDFDKNYTAIWNDESHWNKYLSEHEPSIVLSPSYIYPDSLIKEYYEPIWGKSYEPKIITLTKPFSLSAQGAEDIQKFLKK